MWQEESEATNASSGSMAASTDMGSGTTAGEADAGTSMPPSKRQTWAAREAALGEVALAAGPGQ